MTSAKRRHPNADAPVLWHAVIWIIAVHLLGALGIWYLWAYFHAARGARARHVRSGAPVDLGRSAQAVFTQSLSRNKAAGNFPRYHLDIAKWFIELCSVFGLASGLRSMPKSAVLLRAQRKASQARGPS